MSPLLKQKHFHIPIPWRHQCLVYAYTYPKEKANKILSIFLSTTSILCLPLLSDCKSMTKTYYPPNILMFNVWNTLLHVWNKTKSVIRKNFLSFSNDRFGFNNDEKFEYLIPTYKSEESISGEYDSDGDGISDHRTLKLDWSINGYKVLNEDGQTILELDMEGYDSQIIKLNGNLYLESGGDFFEIDPQSTSVQKVRSVTSSKIIRIDNQLFVAVMVQIWSIFID